jgi:formate hydrogenlyase subunit 6/NADH:ubiquinone oxidoreductase subunit I
MYGIGLARGLAVTLKNLVLPSRMFTVHQYPDRKVGVFGLAKIEGTNVVSYTVKNPGMALKSLVGLVSVEDRQEQHSRFRGQEFTFYEQRCTGCASCAKYCPLGIIRIVTDPSGDAMQEGENYGIEVFDIDIGRCMLCGLCVEACPYDALHMGSGFEEGSYTRSGLVIDVDRLKAAPKRPSTWFRPQLEEKGYDPFAGEELGWRDAGRHEQPSRQELEDDWAKR